MNCDPIHQGPVTMIACYHRLQMTHLYLILSSYNGESTPPSANDLAATLCYFPYYLCKKKFQRVFLCKMIILANIYTSAICNAICNPTFRSVALTKAASLLARKVTAPATSDISPNL